MADLLTKIELYLGRKPRIHDFVDEMVVQNDMDGRGQYISRWNDSIEKPKPTDEQLDAFESQANDLEALDTVLKKRRYFYPSLRDFAEAYAEKEIGGNSSKWDSYVINYNKVRTDNPKPQE